MQQTNMTHIIRHGPLHPGMQFREMGPPMAFQLPNRLPPPLRWRPVLTAPQITSAHSLDRKATPPDALLDASAAINCQNASCGYHNCEYYPRPLTVLYRVCAPAAKHRPWISSTSPLLTTLLKPTQALPLPLLVNNLHGLGQLMIQTWSLSPTTPFMALRTRCNGYGTRRGGQLIHHTMYIIRQLVQLDLYQ